MRMTIPLLLILLTACSTKTIVKTEQIKVPPHLLTECEYSGFDSKETDIKKFSLELAKYSLSLQNTLDKCNFKINQIKEYQDKVTE